MLLTLLLLACFLGGASAPPSPFSLIYSPNWEDRYDGAKMLVKDYPPSDPKIQGALIKLLERESLNPKWEELAELDLYEDYYGEVLMKTVQQIALTYHNEAAFYALVHSVYNADSEFGRWLATQPGAFAILISQTTDARNPVLQRVTSEVLAFAVSFCPPGNQKKTCAWVNRRRDALMATFRGLAHDLANQEHYGTGIICLSICGTRDDLAWMQSLESSPDRDLADFVPLFIQQLEKRLGLPLTPNPPLALPPVGGSSH